MLSMKEVKELANRQQAGEDVFEDFYDDLYDFFLLEMPYGTAKARDGDPYQWIANKLENM